MKMPNKQSFYKNYMELLEDDKFLQWRMIPTEESEAYWLGLHEKYPLLNKEIQRADDYLKNYVAHKQELTAEEQKTLLKQILYTVHRANRKSRKTVWLWATSVAAVIALLVGVFLFRENALPVLPEEQIVGSRLNDKEIQLIAGNRIASFDENVDISIDAAGVAMVDVLGKETEEIPMTESEPVTLVVPYGKRSQLTLSDGSKVWLNSGSTLRFPSVFSTDSRAVILTGEMYVEVSPSRKPFIVNTSAFDVKVYGTKFNVSVYENSAEKSVVLVEGSVGVRLASGQEKMLSPNDMLAFDTNRTAALSHVNTNSYTSWRNGYLTFNDTPISEVLEQIGRYYNIHFNLANNINLQQRRCRGKIFLSDNIDDTMTAISLLALAEYRREGDLIYIRKKTN